MKFIMFLCSSIALHIPIYTGSLKLPVTVMWSIFFWQGSQLTLSATTAYFSAMTFSHLMAYNSWRHRKITTTVICLNTMQETKHLCPWI
jgi:hypothetical protein